MESRVSKQHDSECERNFVRGIYRVSWYRQNGVPQLLNNLALVVTVLILLIMHSLFMKMLLYCGRKDYRDTSLLQWSKYSLKSTRKI